MAERSYSQLPITTSHGGRRMLNTRRGIFPVSESWIHAIPLIIFLCFFTLWCFSHTVTVDMNDGEMISVHRLEKSIAMGNESHVTLAILVASAVSPTSDFVSTNQNLTAHNATKSHNVTQFHNATQSVNKGKQPLAG